MKNIIRYKLLAVVLVLIGLSCTDESLDPITVSQLKQGHHLALRNAGGRVSDKNFFFKDLIFGNEVFTYDAEFISSQQDLLESIDVYAKIADGTRVFVANRPGSDFTIKDGQKNKTGTVSVALDEILTALNVADPTTLKRNDIIIESDLNLADNTVVSASSIVNSGLYSADIFFPAQVLTYAAEVTANFVPKATTKLSTGLAMKAGATDKLLITYDQAVKVPPIVTFSNANISAGPVVEIDKKNYSVDITGVGGTGSVTATISGAVADTYKVDLTQAVKTQTIAVDNTQPQVASSVTGTRIGRGQFVTITINFNEKMSTKAANAIKATITDPNGKLEPVTDAVMTLSSNGLSASLIYLFKELDVDDPAVHGPLNLSYSGGADEAGNAVQGGVTTGGLLVDVGTPPAPSLALDAGGHDLGTQIKWSGTQTTGGSNPGGSVQGTIYFVAVAANASAPTAVAFDQDANAIWTMATGVTQQASGKLATGSGGTTGTQFTNFPVNGTFDIYAVFVGNTGNVSAITTTPQIEDVVMN